MSIEFLAVYASADDNNMFVKRENATTDDDITSNSTKNDETPSDNAASSFKISTGASVGHGRGGDRLLDIKSTSKLSFFPRDIALSEVLVNEMNKDFGKCVQESATAAGMGKVTDINVSHMGGYRDRRVNNGGRSKSWSLHATGRALDIGRIDIVAGGKTHRIPMTKGTNDGRNGRAGSRFYKTFNACWAKNNKNSCGTKSILDCNYNSLHHDHVHISLPYCPRKPGIAST
ncbi:MAG: extensin family protein [Bdellovibrionaceae bacterium]|nr:extensin family protein [Pseudobdellovibrionaceae bacterium]